MGLMPTTHYFCNEGYPFILLCSIERCVEKGIGETFKQADTNISRESWFLMQRKCLNQILYYILDSLTVGLAKNVGTDIRSHMGSQIPSKSHEDF